LALEYAVGARGRALVLHGLFGLEGDTEGGFADAEFGVVAEHGGADTLLFEEGAVGGVEIAKIDVVFADFDDAVVAGDFGVGEGDVGAIAPDDDASFFQHVGGAGTGAGDDREDDIFGEGKLSAEVLLEEGRRGAASVTAGERRERRNGDGGVGMTASVHNSSHGALGAVKFYFGVRAHIGVFQHVLRAAVATSYLHERKISWWRGATWSGARRFAEMVMGAAFEAWARAA
jgi:hypothetical protein